MKAIWVGAAGSPSTSATNYHFITATLSTSWNTGESVRSAPLSDAVTVKRLRVWLQTAPGASKSYTFTLRSAGADTSAVVAISGTNTSGEWSGSVSVSQLNLVAMKSVPASTPTAPVAVYWIIEYETAGNFYLVPSGTVQAQNQDADLYFSAFGGNGYLPSASQTRDEAVIPTGLTVTKIACYSNGTGGNTYWVRKSNTSTDSSFSVANGAGGSPAVSSTGAFAFSAGDTMTIRQHDSSAPWTRHMICITIVPDNFGEVVTAFTSPAAPSTTATTYEGPDGYGDNTWSTTESATYMRFPQGMLKKLYVKLTTAPGTGKNRAFTVRSNTANTAIACTVADTNTTANDTTDTAWHGDGNFLSVGTTPTGTPAATAGAKFSFVIEVPQSHDFFPMF